MRRFEVYAVLDWEIGDSVQVAEFDTYEEAENFIDDNEDILNSLEIYSRNEEN